MKVCLARVGSVSLWAKTEPRESWPPTLHLWMESDLLSAELKAAGQVRQLGMTLNFDEVAVFVKSANNLLRNLKP